MHGGNRGFSGLDKLGFKNFETLRKEVSFSCLNMWGNKYEIGKATKMRKG